MTKKRIVTIIFIVAAAALLMKGKSLLKARQTQIAQEATPSQSSVSVPVVSPREGVMHQEIPFLAQVLSDKSITLSTKLAGYIESIKVKESQAVKKGDILVHIDEKELRSSIEALQSALRAQQNDAALAARVYARNQKLYAVGGLAKEQLEASRVGVELKRSVAESTRQKIAQLEHQLGYLSIIAPFDGEIDRILLHEGDLAAAGKPILSMSNRQQKLLFSYAPTSDNRIAKGQMVVSGTKKIGEVRAIYATSTNGLVTAEVALDAPVGLPIGSSMPIRVLTQSAAGCILPDTTIVHKKEGDAMMVYRDGRFKAQRVEVLMHEGNRILIKQCPKGKIASGSEVKLAALPAYTKVQAIGADDE
jgi:RND family efflux transporter MFP subunit